MARSPISHVYNVLKMTWGRRLLLGLSVVLIRNSCPFTLYIPSVLYLSLGASIPIARKNEASFEDGTRA